MSRRKDYFLFRSIRAAVKLFYPSMKVVGLEKLPGSDSVVVANHSKMNGPICGELYMPDNCYIWCAGQMMNLKEVPAYAFSDFWSEKPPFLRPFYKLLSYIIAPISVCVFNNARTLGVYHDMRSISTFKNTISMLKDGKNMLVFPEKNEINNNILNGFQDRFVDVAKLYYKTTGKRLNFVPMYISPKLKSMYIGNPIVFNENNDICAERERICSYISQTITDIAVNLPCHTVIPYNNIPKKSYLTNKDVTKVPK